MNVWYSWGKCLNIRTLRLWGLWKGNNTLDVVVVENLLGELNHFQTNIGENLVHAGSNFHPISTDTSLTKTCFPNNDPPQGFTSFYNPKYTIFENSCCAKPSIVSALVLDTASIKGSWCSPDREKTGCNRRRWFIVYSIITFYLEYIRILDDEKLVNLRWNRVKLFVKDIPWTFTFRYKQIKVIQNSCRKLPSFGWLPRTKPNWTLGCATWMGSLGEWWLRCGMLWPFLSCYFRPKLNYWFGLSAINLSVLWSGVSSLPISKALHISHWLSQKKPTVDLQFKLFKDSSKLVRAKDQVLSI